MVGVCTAPAESGGSGWRQPPHSQFLRSSIGKWCIWFLWVFLCKKTKHSWTSVYWAGLGSGRLAKVPAHPALLSVLLGFYCLSS